MGDTLDGVNDLEFVYLAGVGESKKLKLTYGRSGTAATKRGVLEFSRVLRILSVLFVLSCLYFGRAFLHTLFWTNALMAGIRRLYA